MSKLWIGCCFIFHMKKTQEHFCHFWCFVFASCSSVNLDTSVRHNSKVQDVNLKLKDENSVPCQNIKLCANRTGWWSIKSFSPCTISLDLFPSSSNSPVLATVVSGTVYPPAFGIWAQNIQESQKSNLINTVDTTSQTLLYSVVEWSGINSRKASALSSPAVFSSILTRCVMGFRCVIMRVET